jgi:polygalacturonase
MNAHMFDVKEYGARPDGLTLNTRQIQTAIDACFHAGGGTVYFQPGDYLSGTIYLKSNVRLYLEAGAILRGSSQIADYDLIGRMTQRLTGWQPWFLIFADGGENMAIEGRGTIDGSGRNFWTEVMLNAHVRKPKEARPRAMIALLNCRNLSFKGVTLRNSPCFTLWLVGCRLVNIDGISIDNPYDGPNTDGLDIDCCQNVSIANCHIKAGDDCIAIKSDADLLGETRPCEHIVVGNCTFSSSACAVRIGYEGDAPIRNCIFSNISIYDTDIGLDIVSILPNRDVAGIDKGADIDNISFNNIVMKNVQRAFFLWMGNERKDGNFLGRIQHIQFNNISAEASRTSYISGCEERKIESISMRNVDIRMIGGMTDKEPEAGFEVWGLGTAPYGVWCRHVSDLSLDNVALDWKGAHGEWLYFIYCENASDVRIRGLQNKNCDHVTPSASIRLDRVQGASIQGSIADGSAKRFLWVSDTESRSISLMGNNLQPAQSVYAVKDEKGDVVSVYP